MPRGCLAPLTVSQVEAAARNSGFDFAGVVAAGGSRRNEWMRGWLKAGFHGEMAYLAREASLQARGAPEKRWPWIKSTVVVARGYGASPAPLPNAGNIAFVARYARGRDYHEEMRKGLDALAGELSLLAGRPARARSHVDAGPLAERELAQRAGLGWIGKNTLLIHPRAGSYFFLGALLTDLDIEKSEPFLEDRCGTCERCEQACPTGALLGRDWNGAPVMDSRLCISYLTIEYRGVIPRRLRPLMGNHVFGCDICQEVCPWNRKFSPRDGDPAYAARSSHQLGMLDRIPLVELADRLVKLSNKGFQKLLAGTPLTRAGRKTLLRSVCVALGNWGSEEATPVLSRALRDPAPVVRAHAVWALGRIGTKKARRLLREHGKTERSELVRAEPALSPFAAQ